MRTPLKLLLAAGAIFASLALSACSSKPVDELKMAGVAREEASKVEASEYAPLDWMRAKMQWEAAAELIQMGRNKEAKDVLIEAVASFNTASDKAKRRVESLRIEIAALQNSAEVELRKIVGESQSSKIKPLAKMRIEAAIPRVDEKIGMMNAAFEEKEYLRSRMAGHEAMRYMMDLEKRLGISQ
jgi:hypothetical protein